MKFGNCSDCGEYKYLETDNKCNTCCSGQIKIYDINNAPIVTSLSRILFDDEYQTSVLEKDTILDIINKVKPTIKTVYISEDVVDKITEVLNEYKRKNKEADPIFQKSIDEVNDMEHYDILCVDELDDTDFELYTI